MQNLKQPEVLRTLTQSARATLALAVYINNQIAKALAINLKSN